MTDALAIAQRWAHLLDEEAFTELRDRIADDCVYHAPNGTMTDAVAIIDSYANNAAWAHRTFDQITWESAVDAEPDGRYRITFSDHTVHRGQRHTYRCQQIVRVNDAGLICAIEHVSIPEEEAGLAAFFERVGVQR